MVNSREQNHSVTPTLDEFQHHDQCREALKIGEAALINSEIMAELVSVQQDSGLLVRLSVVGAVKDAVTEVAEEHGRFTKGLEISHVRPITDERTIPRIGLELALPEKDDLSPGIEEVVRSFRPTLSISATPMHLSFTFHNGGDLPELKDFPHSLLTREPGREMLREVVSNIKKHFSSPSPEPLPVLQ